MNKDKEDKPPSSQSGNLTPSAQPGDPAKAPAAAPVIKRFFNRLMRVFGLRVSSSIGQEFAEILEERDPEGKEVSDEERVMLNNVLGIGELKVGDIMIPRTDIISVTNKVTLSELKKLITDKEHTRMPIYKESLDNVIGFIHIKDLVPLLGTKKPFVVEDVIREILYIPPSMKVLDLLVKMRAKRVHMALVLDEYGGTEGLVTMEDLMEEIVGDIEDEHDETENKGIKALGEDVFEVNARSNIHELETSLGKELKTDDDEDFDTVGGLIFFMLGRVPEKGEVIKHQSGVEFRVVEADPRRVKKLMVKNQASNLSDD